MNRVFRTILAVFFIAVITFSAISITQNLGKRLKFDATEQRLYTLSAGTRSILSRLRQPVKMKLYYTKTAAMKGPDQIRYFNNYYHFVRSLLEEYATAAKGMVELEVIDPRPFTDEEASAMSSGLKRIPMSEEESFFFGLVLQTPFGVTKTISFFSPGRENLVEYDISRLIDTAITREKKRIGVLSSLPVMGEDMTGYMAQMMRMQGQQPKSPWAIIQQLREKYDVEKIETDLEKIEGIDILLIVHPKDLSEKALFAIDQFVLGGGRTIVCIDPYALIDRPPRGMPMMQTGHSSGSNLEPLIEKWGLKMPQNTFAGDRKLALVAAMGSNQRPQKIIGLLGLTKDCFNDDLPITAQISEVRVLFPGAIKKINVDDSNETSIERTPLMSTTERGNTWKVDNQFELMVPDAERLMNKFTDGFEPVHMAYMVTGRFKSAFPNGIEITEEKDEPNETEEPNSVTRTLTGLAKAETDCAVAVFSDVDFISDLKGIAYEDTFFGKIPVGDNAALLMNTIDQLVGSGDLISIRSRGNFARPFTVVDEIEAEAEKATADEEKKVQAEIARFEAELNKILSGAKQGEQEVIGSSIVRQRRELEAKLHTAQAKLRELKMQKRKKIEKLGSFLRSMNTLPGPAAILLIAVVLGLYRSIKKKHYVSHASDA